MENSMEKYKHYDGSTSYILERGYWDRTKVKVLDYTNLTIEETDTFGFYTFISEYEERIDGMFQRMEDLLTFRNLVVNADWLSPKEKDFFTQSLHSIEASLKEVEKREALQYVGQNSCICCKRIQGGELNA